MSHCDLICNNPKNVIVMLDAYDEIRNVAEDQKLELFHQIKDLADKGVQFILTSRYIPSELKKSLFGGKGEDDSEALFVRAKYLQLKESQIKVLQN